MHSPHGIYRAEVLNISTIRLYVGDTGGERYGREAPEPERKIDVRWEGKGASCKLLQSGGEGEEGKKRG